MCDINTCDINKITTESCACAIMGDSKASGATESNRSVVARGETQLASLKSPDEASLTLTWGEPNKPLNWSKNRSLSCSLRASRTCRECCGLGVKSDTLAAMCRANLKDLSLSKDVLSLERFGARVESATSAGSAIKRRSEFWRAT